jgi:hypothetical protein
MQQSWELKSEKSRAGGICFGGAMGNFWQLKIWRGFLFPPTAAGHLPSIVFQLNVLQQQKLLFAQG